MKYSIYGDNLQMVTLELAEGEQVYAEAGAMMYMSSNMAMEPQAKGGFWKGVERKMMGESFFLINFYPVSGEGIVAFAGSVPGTLKVLDITPGRDFILQKDAFIVGEMGVQLEITFQQKLGSAFFGGEGFVLERLSGSGMAFVHGCGDFVELELEYGQSIKVDTGCVVGWESTVRYDIKRTGGFKKIVFGGEGLFLAQLWGPGKVILQSMSIAQLLRGIMEAMQRGGGT